MSYEHYLRDPTLETCRGELWSIDFKKCNVLKLERKVEISPSLAVANLILKNLEYIQMGRKKSANIFIFVILLKTRI